MYITRCSKEKVCVYVCARVCLCVCVRVCVCVCGCEPSLGSRTGETQTTPSPSCTRPQGPSLSTPPFFPCGVRPASTVEQPQTDYDHTTCSASASLPPLTSTSAVCP